MAAAGRASSSELAAVKPAQSCTATLHKKGLSDQICSRKLRFAFAAKRTVKVLLLLMLSSCSQLDALREGEGSLSAAAAMASASKAT